MSVEVIIFRNVSNEHFKEDNIKEFIKDIPEGSVFYDLGANLGWFSLYASALGLNTYAFEMDKFNFEGLEENIWWNKSLKGSIKAYNKGVAGFSGKCDMLYTNEEVGGHNKVLDLDDFSGPHKAEDFHMKRQIDVINLDEFIKELNLPYPEYLKIDIDGSEYSFLKGNPETLNNAKGLVIELCTSNKFFDECVNILESFGFAITKKYEIPGWDNGFNYVFSK